MNCSYCTNRIKHTHDREYIEKVTKPTPAASHTPTEKWIVRSPQVFMGITCVWIAEGSRPVLKIEGSNKAKVMEDANRIVHAMNCHEMLIEALKGATQAICELIPEDAAYPEFAEMKKELIQALAKAGEAIQ